MPDDVAVRKELGASGAIVLHRALFDKQTFVQQGYEHVLDHFEVVLGMGLREEAEPDPQVLDGLLVDAVISFGDLLGVVPSFSAVTVTGVPCWSDPETISTSLPLRMLNFAKMSGEAANLSRDRGVSRC